MTERTYTAAVAQVSPAFLDLDASLSIAVRAIEEAASAGARLVVFPETWLPGYPVWADAGIAWEDGAQKRAFARLHRNAVEVPGPATQVLGRAARAGGVHLVIGMTERDARFSGGTLFNSLLFMSDEGTVLGVHRKLVPTHSERVIWGRGDGSTLHVFDTSLGRIGGLICWEHWMPLARFSMHAKGEQVHAAVWPDLPEMHHLASRTYAFEGRCYVTCAGIYLPLDAVPDDLEVRDAIVEVAKTNDDPSLVLIGGSGIVDPAGAWIADPVEGRESLILGEIDLDRIAEEQQALDTAGHYHRPDVFRVTVDETPQVPVTWQREEEQHT
ncbi:MAG TPA: carbon-nitrogen hydrolase family protein [Actinomycetota bacterium]|nr:carbon-nitrogen hydrolase family protein [Actinomycetota bacterium]